MTRNRYPHPTLRHFDESSAHSTSEERVHSVSSSSVYSSASPARNKQTSGFHLGPDSRLLKLHHRHGEVPRVQECLSSCRTSKRVRAALLHLRVHPWHTYPRAEARSREDFQPLNELPPGIGRVIANLVGERKDWRRCSATAGEHYTRSSTSSRGAGLSRAGSPASKLNLNYANYLHSRFTPGACRRVRTPPN